MRYFWVFFLMVFFCVPFVFAADSITGPTCVKSIGILNCTWVALSDDGDGAIAGGQTTPLFGMIIGVKLVPSTTNPPDSDWDLELRDAESNFDWLFGDFSSNGTSTKVLAPLDANNAYPPLFGERLSVSATGMGGTGSDGFTLYLRIKE